ncbi:MAG: hypothetical protein ACRDXD_02055, partial [Acidimicrobiia bacterium]
MNRLALLLALSSGLTVGAASWAVLRPPRRLSGRVRPYAHVARARLLRSADPDTYLAVTRTPATLRAALTPLVERLSRLHARVLGPRDEELLALRLRHSGLYPGLDADERLRAFRTRTLLTAAAAAVALAAVGWQSQGG